jgi:hypothetical protein
MISNGLPDVGLLIAMLLASLAVGLVVGVVLDELRHRCRRKP